MYYTWPSSTVVIVPPPSLESRILSKPGKLFFLCTTCQKMKRCLCTPQVFLQTNPLEPENFKYMLEDWVVQPGTKEDIFCMWRKYWLLNIGWELYSPRLSWPSYWSLQVNKPFKCAINYELWTTNLSLTWDKGAVSKIVIWFQISEDKNECVYGSNNKLKNSSQCIDVVFLFGLPFWLTTWGRHTFASEWL